MHIFHAIQGWIVSFGESVWALVATFALSILDGFFPPLPSESVLIALASLTVSENGPNLIALWAIAATGAWIGDQIAYTIGMKIPIHKVPFLNKGKGARTYAKSGVLLFHHGPLFIMAARFIPIGRMAVNLCAGSVGYRRSTFMIVDALAAMAWAAYSIAIGVGAGHILGDQPLVAMIVGICGGVLAGFVLNKIIVLVWSKFRPDRLAAAEAAAEEWMDRYERERAENPTRRDERRRRER